MQPVTLAALRQQIDHRLADLLPRPHDEKDRVAAAMRDGLLAPGKRTRPLLMLLAGHGLGCGTPALLDVACAVEMVHTASLFLDDMPCMDNAWLRRGRPSTHARYGQDVAMLGAVALLSRAWFVVASADGLPDALRAQLVMVLCEAVGHDGLVRGQYRDLHEGATSRAAHDIASTNDQKTGVLFAAALDMAARMAATDGPTRSLLLRAAGEMGQAFQMRDDLEDGAEGGTEDGADRTKDRHKDDGKSTLVALLGRDEVRRRLKAHLGSAEACLRQAFPRRPEASSLMLQAFGIAPRHDGHGPETAEEGGHAPTARPDRAADRQPRRPDNGLSMRN
jgi:geranylgeranyl diphosphate synthase, type II